LKGGGKDRGGGGEKRGSPSSPYKTERRKGEEREKEDRCWSYAFPPGAEYEGGGKTNPGEKRGEEPEFFL